MRNCNRAVHFVQQSACPATKMNQNTFLTPNEKTDAVGTNEDLFSLHAKVFANKDGASNPILPIRNCNRAVCFMQSPVCTMLNMDRNTFSTPNKKTDVVGTNQDLFSIHAKVLANKEGASNPISFMRNFNKAVHCDQSCVKVPNWANAKDEPHAFNELPSWYRINPTESSRSPEVDCTRSCRTNRSSRKGGCC